MKYIVDIWKQKHQTIYHCLLITFLSIVVTNLTLKILKKETPEKPPSNNNFWVAVNVTNILESNLNQESFYKLAQTHCNECLVIEGLKINQIEKSTENQKFWIQFFLPDTINKNRIVEKVAEKTFQLKFSHLTHFEVKSQSRELSKQSKIPKIITY